MHNFEIARHRHPGFFQMFLITAGHGELLGAADTHLFFAPSALFIPPGAVHGFRFARDVDGLVVTALADRLNLIAGSDRMLHRFAEEIRIVSLAARQSEAPGAIRALAAEIGGMGCGRSLLLDALITTAVVGLARTWNANERPAGDGPRAGAADRLAALDELVGTHFREQRDLAFYAGRLGISPSHLNRLARTGRGMTVNDLVARHRVEAARRDLIFTPTPVAAIAASLGFHDPAYFNRFFRRQTGSTPGAYRREERERLAAS